MRATTGRTTWPMCDIRCDVTLTKSGELPSLTESDSELCRIVRRSQVTPGVGDRAHRRKPHRAAGATLRGARRGTHRSVRRRERHAAMLSAVVVCAAELDSAAGGAGAESTATEGARPDPVATQTWRGPAAERQGKSPDRGRRGSAVGGKPSALRRGRGARITRQRRLARWTDGSTWLWTSFRNQVGQGEGASNLRFDEVLEPSGATSAP